MEQNKKTGASTPLPNREGQGGESSFFNPEFETMSREQIEALQLERLQKTVRHCMNSPFYKKRFEEIGLRPEDIKSLADLKKIPFTTKQDLRDTYPFGIASASMLIVLSIVPISLRSVLAKHSIALRLT